MFLHGYLSSKESFNFQTEYLSKFYRTIAIDITGFGKSKKLTRPYSLNDYVLDILCVLDALAIRKCHIIAHSFGGRIAIKLVNFDKNRVDKLVLTGCAGLKPKRKLSYFIKVYGYKILKPFLSQKARNKFGSEEYKSLDSLQKQSYVKIVNEHLDEFSKLIKNETLLIFGENDKETPIYMAKKLKENVKNSNLYIVKDSGHFCFVEKPLEFNVLVKEFLR